MLESGNSFSGFIRKATKMNREMFVVLTLVRLKYYSTGVMNDFCNVLSEQLSEIKVLMWASVLPNRKRNRQSSVWRSGQRW
jgi:hypothetical protein